MTPRLVFRRTVFPVAIVLLLISALWVKARREAYKGEALGFVQSHLPLGTSRHQCEKWIESHHLWAQLDAHEPIVVYVPFQEMPSLSRLKGYIVEVPIYFDATRHISGYGRPSPPHLFPPLQYQIIRK
ncbi:MAG: hypothetical protein EOO38_21430 [Cytophagaceae bacterium]|nr:MAG: hypothetical protein EOO38_21430 [Cytophagaceae bacterium]